MAQAQGLAALEARLAQDLAWLELPPKAWIPPQAHDGQAVLDVVVIGGGMAGLTAATALKMLGIQAVVLDKASVGQEGPWVTSARMETLRSPKVLTGPALGLPALTFRAWYEAQFGVAAWDALDKIPRPQWMDYLRWFRRVMAVDLRNDHAVEAIEPTNEGHVRLQVRHQGALQTLLARRVVLATGRDGLGSAWLPPEAQHIPPASARTRPTCSMQPACMACAWPWWAAAPRPWTAPPPPWKQVPSGSICWCAVRCCHASTR